MNDDQRQIKVKGYVPIEVVGNGTSQGKSVYKEHISTLHVWSAWQSSIAARHYELPTKAIEQAPPACYTKE